MHKAGESTEIEAEFERDLARDRSLRQAVTIASWVISLSTVALLLILIMPLGHTSPWLILLSAYAAGTRLGAFVVSSALMVPAFFLHLQDDDPEARSAARAVLDRHRATLLPPVLRSRLRPADDATVAALPYETVAKLAYEHDIARKRRTATICFAVWCVVSAAVWTILVVTGGGPVEGTR